MYNLLVIDDDPVFEYIVGKTFNRSPLFNKTTFFPDANGALSYLEANKLDPTELPDMILLDLYMPVLNGWDFMKRFEIINNGFIKKVPVCILTSSINPLDIKISANFKSIQSFISKPLTSKLIDNIYSFCQNMNDETQPHALKAPLKFTAKQVSVS